MNVGERYSLAWKFPHRIEVIITDLGADRILVEAVHRCPPTCKLLQMRTTLPIEGEMKYRYGDFHALFLPLNDAAIALPA